MKPTAYLKAGDVVEAGIDGIGKLHNKCEPTSIDNN
jgi:2-keto-4-pentenoate hydratase/2-oxohepta-3-ene-1,7-dioic acid hydratase in catechol pathway